ERLNDLFRQLRGAIRLRREPYCIMHIRSHKWNEGLGEGNQRADKLVSLIVPQNQFVMARESHSMFHQNAKGLYRQFGISLSDAKGIVASCPVCSHYGPGLGVGVNPRGAGPLELWQMDVTHVGEFGRLKYVHVSIDTFSGFIWATPQTGEKAINVRKHLLASFAVMGVPQAVKTDNGPAYTSQTIRQFMLTWGIKHSTGIANVPTGQAIIERAHQTLKQYL
ncbi:hypothetical protein N307_14514, partial [Dryobates pubescens]